MTLEELNALPEVGGIGQREEIRDGKKVIIPVAGDMFALYHAPDDPLLIRDDRGRAWSVGSARGQKWKRRMRSHDAEL